MEGIGAKRVMVVILMLFLAVVQADYSHSSPSDSKGRHCILQCGAKCLLSLKIVPIQYMLCFNLCMLECRISPSDVTYNCTQDCAQSKTNNLESGMRIFILYSLPRLFHLQFIYHFSSQGLMDFKFL
jgi:hypothetical protein